MGYYNCECVSKTREIELTFPNGKTTKFSVGVKRQKRLSPCELNVFQDLHCRIIKAVRKTIKNPKLEVPDSDVRFEISITATRE